MQAGNLLPMLLGALGIAALALLVWGAYLLHSTSPEVDGDRLAGESERPAVNLDR